MTSGLYSIPQTSWLRFMAWFGKGSWWITVLLLFGAIADLGLGLAPAHAAADDELELRVAIEQNTDQVLLGSSTPATIRDESGQVVAQLPAVAALTVDVDAGKITVDLGDTQKEARQLWVEPSNGGYVYIGNKYYRGRATVVPTGADDLTAVNYVDLEQYLYSVVGSEMPPSWHPEALKAQAVAARTYALYKRQTSANAVFDVGDTTTWQVYDGIAKETDTTQRAVNETKGQVLTYSGQIIDAVFHACAGGYTENVEDVWTAPLPYLRGVRAYDETFPACQWTNRFSAADLTARFSGVGNVISITPQSVAPSGRVLQVLVTGDMGSRVMTGAEIRRALGLRSSQFAIAAPQMQQVASAGDIPSVPTEFLFNGRGYGHGLGMSQWGAYALAQNGNNYQQILHHFYTDVTLSRIQVQ